MIAFAAPRWRISQCGSPGSEFSATSRRPVLARGVAPAAGGPGLLVLHPDAAARAPIAPRPRKARLLAPPCGLLPSRVMADRRHPHGGPRKQDARSRSSDHGPFSIRKRPTGPGGVRVRRAVSFLHAYL